MPFFQKRGWSGESSERQPWASEREREDDRETELPRGLRGCILQEDGERVFVSRSRFLRVINITTQPDPDGICFWVENATLININLDK